MKRVKFAKMVASGNDFAVIEGLKVSRSQGLKDLVKKICDRKSGVGADGVLLLEKSRRADLRMRVFNADGSEAEMCGNGARCAVLYTGRRNARLETKAGIIESRADGENIKVRLTDPGNIRLDIPIKVNRRNLKVNFIDTGVPHAVLFVEGLDEIHVDEIGRLIRFHKKFAPAGANADFVEALSKNLISIRTYERGVEDETLACGTGSVAAALIFSLKSGEEKAINVLTKGGETLKVYFKKSGRGFRDVWLEGKARMVHKGEYYV